jgi:hypothetical protein
MNFPLNEFKAAVKEYDENWKALDTCLYALCRKFTGHVDPGETNAKCWIIGRTYATGIERKIATTGAQGSSMTQLAQHLFAHREMVDGWLQTLMRLREPLDPDKLQTILAIHGTFTNFLRPILRNNVSPRSFASKYLHFHCPAVPIFDSFAVKNLARFVRWHAALLAFEIPPDADELYSWHVLRFWKLYQEARTQGAQVSVKCLDYFLLSRG